MPRVPTKPAYPRRRLNESMQLLFPRETVKSHAKQNFRKHLNKDGGVQGNHAKSQTLASRNVRNDGRKDNEKETKTLTKAYSLNKTMLSNGTKTSAPSLPQDSSISPNKGPNSPRATLSTVKKGQLPDSMVKMLAEYTGGFRDVEDFMVSTNCIAHNSKKAKFMVRGRMQSAGLCSKCAVMLAKDGYWVEEISLESSAQKKRTQLETFVRDLNRCVERYDSLQERKASKVDEYVQNAQTRLDIVEGLFRGLRDCLEAKKQNWVESIRSDLDRSVYDVENYGRWLADNKAELNLMRTDIKSNYNDIIERVDRPKFEEILSHFKEKLQELSLCAEETSLPHVTAPEKLDSKGVVSQFDTLTERLLLNNTQGSYPRLQSRLMKSNINYDNILISQTASLKQPTNESGVSIEFAKPDIDNIYFNYGSERFNDRSFGIRSEALLSDENIKPTGSVGQLNGYKHAL